MLKTLTGWMGKRRRSRAHQRLTLIDEQLLAELGVTWQDLEAARTKRAIDLNEGSVFP
ncbi:hypothetical protein GCM10010862_03380 [Devosia nitrariae]|uniref:DUF1127 domain-containing protein n=1 Tax=Devosia nitrariae TaxID=2071872 RepID=A0ABQ5W091_9HYPH|nr:hypothetical protein GCM10010862_03380 [Devosia nitrariae]